MTRKIATDKVFSGAEIAAHLPPHWTQKDGEICRVYKTHGWQATLMVVGAIGHLAEAAWHHPELAVSYGQVEVRLSTHSAGGITEKDFSLARQIEAVVPWRPAGAASPDAPGYLKEG